MKPLQRSLVALCLFASVLLASALCDAAAGKSPGKAAATAAPSKAGVVNLNTASEEQLQLLPRIGPSKARAIVKFRSRQKFKATWDLVQVKGIGRKTYRRLRPYLAVQGETTLASKPDSAAKP